MKEKKRIKKKIGVGSVLNAKFEDMGDNKREVRIRRMRKYVVGCVQAVVRKKRFSVQFEYGQNKQMSYFLLVFVCSKEEVEIN